MIWMQQKQKAYRKENLEAYNNYRNNYRTKNARGIYDVLVQGAKKREIEVTITRDEFELWHNSEPKICFYCQRKEETILKTDAVMQIKCNRLTIDRVDNNLGYSLGNIKLCCKRCNAIKSNYFTKDEMFLIGQIIKQKSITDGI